TLEIRFVDDEQFGVLDRLQIQFRRHHLQKAVNIADPPIFLGEEDVPLNALGIRIIMAKTSLDHKAHMPDDLAFMVYMIALGERERFEQFEKRRKLRRWKRGFGLEFFQQQRSIHLLVSTTGVTSESRDEISQLQGASPLRYKA